MGPRAPPIVKIKIKIKIEGCSTGDPAYPENRKVIKTSHSRG